jgi:hypothetical protein
MDTTTNTAPNTSEGEGKNTGAVEGAQPVSATTGAEAASGSATQEARFTQADIDRIVKDRLAEEGRKAEAKNRKAAETAEAAKLAEQGEFKKLADTASAKVAELEPFKEKAERHETALKAILGKQREGLPKHILTLLDKLDPVEQLEYIAANAAEFARPTAPNVNAKDGAGTATKDPKAEEARLRSQYRI